MIHAQDLLRDKAVLMMLHAVSVVVPGAVHIVPFSAKLHRVPCVVDVVDPVHANPRLFQEQVIGLGITVADAEAAAQYAVRVIMAVCLVIIRVICQPVVEPQRGFIITGDAFRAALSDDIGRYFVNRGIRIVKGREAQTFVSPLAAAVGQPYPQLIVAGGKELV